MLTFLNCASADPVQEHDLYRLTFVPPSEILAALLEWGRDFAAQSSAMFNAVSSAQGATPAQGYPTVIDTPAAGKVTVFDVKVAWDDAQGWTVQQLADSFNSFANEGFNLTITQVERLSPVTTKTASKRPTEQTVSGAATGAAVEQASVSRSVVTALKWTVVAVVAVAIIYGLTKVPKLG